MPGWASTAASNRTVQQTRARAQTAFSLLSPCPLPGLVLWVPVAEVCRIPPAFRRCRRCSACFRDACQFGTRRLPQIVVRRILVSGRRQGANGTWRRWLKSDPTALIVGFYPSPIGEEGSRCQRSGAARSRSLTGDRPAPEGRQKSSSPSQAPRGVLPSRRLLVTKLSGVRVLDLASRLNRPSGRPPRFPLCGLADDLRRRFSPGDSGGLSSSVFLTWFAPRSFSCLRLRSCS